MLLYFILENFTDIYIYIVKLLLFGVKIFGEPGSKLDKACINATFLQMFVG